VSDAESNQPRGQSCEAPTRHALGWQDPQFYDAGALQEELERVLRYLPWLPPLLQFCADSFPTLFSLIDDSKTGELDGVDKKAFGKWSTSATSVTCAT